MHGSPFSWNTVTTNSPGMAFQGPSSREAIGPQRYLKHDPYGLHMVCLRFLTSCSCSNEGPLDKTGARDSMYRYLARTSKGPMTDA